MPQPWPQVSPDHAKRTAAPAAGGVLKRPVIASLRWRPSSNHTRYDTVCPAGRPASATRPARSSSGVTAGPATRRAAAKPAPVSHSTSMRAGRSQRAHTTAPSPATSPAWTP